MKTFIKIGSALVVASVLAAAGSPGPGWATSPVAQPRQAKPPVIIADDDFQDFVWSVTAAVSGSGTYTVTTQATGGNPGAFRFMSHRLPPVSGAGVNTIWVTQLLALPHYNPSVQGEIRAIDYAEDGIILSFPFADAFSTTQPVIEQDGRIFRAAKFLRFTAQNSSHSWETQTLDGLAAVDFVATDGSGDHPNFLADGGTMRFGFTRTNSRSSTLPAVPADQDLVIDQGMDNWQITIHRDNTNRAPNAADDWFILDGSDKSPPIIGFFDVLHNDNDANHDRLEVIAVTEPFWGRAASLSRSSIFYELNEPKTTDSFSYTISDGLLTSSAQVQVLVDCACTVTCLSSIDFPEEVSHATTDTIDLPLIYRVRDEILKQTPDGRRYTEIYYTANPEILLLFMTNEPLRNEAIAALELWQAAFSSLTDGDGSAIISQAQVDALESFVNHLAAAANPELQELIAAELARLGPLDDYVGLTIRDAKRRAIGDATLYLPLVLPGL